MFAGLELCAQSWRSNVSEARVEELMAHRRVSGPATLLSSRGSDYAEKSATEPNNHKRSRPKLGITRNSA